MEPGEELPELKEAPLAGNGVSIDATDATNPNIDASFAATNPLAKGESRLKRNALLTVLVPVGVILLLMLAGLTVLLSTSQESERDSTSRQQPTNQVDTTKLPEISFEVASESEATEVVFNNKVVANGALVLSPALQPTESVLGQIYYDELTQEVRVFNGESYSSLLEKEAGRQLCYVGEDCGFATLADIPTVPSFPDVPDFPEQVELPQDLAVTATPTFAGINLSNSLEVSEGGTGVSSFANNTLLIGNGSGAIGTTNSATSGQLVVANATGRPQFRSLSGDATLSATGSLTLSNNTVDASELVDTGVTAGTFGDTNNFPVVTVDADGRITAISTQAAPGAAGSVASVNSLTGALLIQGTSNQINVASLGSTITLSTPQDLAATSSPTFNGLTVASITRGLDTITDFTGTGLQVVAGQLETTLGNSIDSSEIVDGTIQSTDIESTNIVGVSEDGYVLTYDNATNGFTWLDPSTLSSTYVAGDGLSLTTNTFSINAPTCSGTDKLQWNGTAFLCAADVDTDTDTTYTAGTNLDLAGTVFNVINNPTFSGLVTANGGVTIQLGDNFTINGEAFTDLTGTGLQYNAGLLETTLGLSIQDAEVDNDLTISSSGSVADGALSANVSLLGSSIDLTSEIVGTLSVSNGGTGATTAAAARTNLGLGTLAVLNSVTTAQIDDDTILAVDFDNTVAPGATEDGYVLTYDDATGGFTWVSQGSVVSGGGGDTTPDTIADDGTITLGVETTGTYDSTPDTIADDGVISDAEAADDLTISGSGSVADGALSVNVSLLGSSIDLATEITGTLSVSNGGTGATTAAQARTNLGLGNLAVLNSVTSTEITNDTILAVDFNNTLAPGATEDGYVLTYDDATGGFTWVSQASVGGSGGDTTPDTIADDGSISLTTEVGGTLPAANGGTGLTSYTTGDIIYASAANTLSTLGIGSNNQCLIISGGVPTWGSCSGGGGAFTNLTLTADSGSDQTLNDTDTINIAGGTNINTVVGSTDTVTVNLDASPTITGLLSLTNAGTALNVTNNVTIGGTLTLGTTTFSEADLDALDDGVIALGSETTGTYDSTPDTIADDGVISDAEAADDLTISAGGSVADGALSANVSLLGSSIQDGEVDDDLTISAGGSVADGALSTNVTLQGNIFNGINQLVQLDGSGALPALNAANLTSLNATNIASGTLADARLSANVSLLGVSIESSEITNDTILAVDFDNTLAPGATEDDYVLTYDDATGGFTWVSQASIVSGGGGDTTPDTIADDGVISDAEAADDLTISAGGSVADGALSANVSLLGNSIDLTSEIVGTLAVADGGTGATTAAAARTNLGLGGLAVLNSITTSEITNDTILAVDFNNTVAPGATEDGYVLTYDDATGGFTWLSQGSVVSGGGGDTTPDTIADDGVISDAEAADDLTISASGSVADGALSSNVSLLGATIEDLEVSDAITISAGGSVADGALSANVSLLGSSIDLTSEIVGTLAVGNGGTGLTSFTTGDLMYASAANTLSSLAIGSDNQCLLVSGGVPTWGSCVVGGGGFTNLTLAGDSGTNQTINDTDTIDIAGGTNINTVVGATDTVTVNLDSAPTITGLLSLTNAGTALNVTNDATIGGDLTVTGNLVVGATTFSEADLDALDDGVIALGTETTGTYDSTPDTIADDGVISDAEAADDLTISGSGSVADGALSTNVSLLGSSIDLTSEITGTLAVSNGGTGVTSIAVNGVVIGNGTSAVQTATGTAGQVLIADALGVPTFTSFSGDVTVDETGATNLVTDSLGVNNGNGITGGGTITLGGSRTLSLGDLTADWVQSAGYDIVLDNAGSELRIREASGIFYGEIDVADITADRLYTFPDVDGDVSILGQTIENAELANSSITVTAGTGLTGGGSPSLGGSVTLNSSLGTSIEGSEITNGTIEGVDLEVTSAGTDDYILTFDSASGGFEWVNPSAVGVTLSEAEVEDFIFDGDNGVKILSSGQLALDSLTYSGTLDDTYVNNTLTIGSSSTVDDGALSANVSLLGSSITLGSETTGNYVESIATGSGLQGGVAGVGSTPTLALGDLTSDWNQTAAFDIILDNTDSQLQVLDDAGTFYGEFNVSGLTSNQSYTFGVGGTVLTSGNIDSFATTGVTAGNGLVGGGTIGAFNLDIGAGSGLTVNADDIEVNFGTSAGTAVEGDTTITVNGGTGLSGGGTLTLGAGGALTLNSNIGDTVETGEITNDTILAIDLDNTTAPGAPQDTFVATYDDASGGFTWVSQASIAGAGGVTSLNSLTGGLNIVGNSQVGVSPSGSDINLSINSGSIGAAQLASTSVAASSYGSASQVGTFTVDADGRLTTAGNTAIAVDASAITSGTLAVNRGGTGAATHTLGGVLLGNGTGTIQNTGVLTNGQLLIGDGTGAPSVATLTQGSGITVTNGSGSIILASTLGTTIEGSEITNGTIEAVDLESTNVAGAGTDDYLLTYDDATGGFTYVDGSTVGTTLSEAEVEAYIFDGDNSGTLSSGTLALNSLNYTGNLTVAEGGTGLTAAGAAGGVYYSTGTAFANNGVGTAGQCLLSNGAGAPTWGNCGGSGAGAVTLQVAYNQGNVITTTNARDLNFTLANTATDSDFVVNIAASSTSEIAFQNNGSTLFRVDSGGIDLLDVDAADFTGATVTFDAGEILETEIAQNSLDDSEIQDNALTAGSLATDSVNSDEIAANAVGASEIATNAVNSDEIAANAVGSSELASTAVGSGSYGSASTVATFTVDADGRLTAAGNTSINATLGTNTSGSYVESISAASLGGLSVTGGSGEGSTPTIALDQSQTLASNPALSANQVIFGTTGLLFEGSSANSNETLLTAANSTADRTITLPNASGTVAVSATGNIDLNSSGQISFTGTLPVSSGGTGAITLAEGVLLGNGTGAIGSTGTLSNGQLLIGDGSGAPTAATLTQGAGITVTNGAGTITVVSTLGTNINSSELVDGTIAEVDLDISNSETSGWLLSSDGSGGFTWVDPSSVGIDEDTVEAYIFDGDNTGTLSSGTLALNSLSYTGDLNDAQINNSLTITSGSVNGSVLTAGSVVNGSLANSSITVSAGNGLAGGGVTSLGGSATLNLGALTANWNQTGAFDIELNNQDSEIRILESGGGTDFATLDVGSLTGDQTFTFTNGGTILTTGNIAGSATTGVTAGSGLIGGGTIGVYDVSVGAGTGISVNANDIEVDYGSTSGTAVEGNTTITVTAGTGITGGGSITLGSGGSVTLNNELGDSISSSEIVNGTIQEVDLEATNAPTDDYLLTYDNATGGFTWVVPSAVGADEATIEAYIFDGDNSGTLSSGTLALNSLSYTGSLTTSNGGTGLTSAGAAGGVYYSNGSTFANSGAGTSGQCLLSNGSGAPSWGNCGGSGAGAVTLQTAYDNGNQLDTTDNRDILFNLTNTTTDSDFIVNIQGADTQVFDVQNSGTSVLTVDGSGDVGIGDSTPSYKLDVNGTGRFTNDLLVDGNVDLGNHETDTITFNGEVDSNILPSTDDTYNLGSSTARWQDLYLGPASLHVFCSAAECGSDRDYSLGVIEAAGADQGNLRLGISGASNLVISTAGNVGIANTTPSFPLDVTGIIRSSTGFRVGSSNGVAVSCGGNAYIESIVVAGGIVTGGTCQADIDTNSGGDITSVGAGDGLTGGGSSGGVTLNVVGGTCITANANDIAITGNCIGTGQIATNGVAAAEIAAGAVGTSEIATNGVAAAEIAAGAVGQSEIATSGVASAEIQDGTVTSTDIATNTIAAGDIGANAINNSEINNSQTFTATAWHGSSVGSTGSSSSLFTQNTAYAGTGHACYSTSGSNYIVARCNPSSARYKNTITNYAQSSGLDAVRQLRAVTYYYNSGLGLSTTEKQVGFIAEEVAAIDPLLAQYNADGTIETVAYEKLTTILSRAIQELDLQVQSSTARISSAESRLSVLESTTSSLTKKNLTVTNEATTAKLSVIGTATINNLKVNGTTEVADIEVNGKIITAGDTPSAVLGASAGSGSYYIVEGNDTAGYVEVQTGTTVSDGEQIEVTFDEAYDVEPRIAVTAKDAESASVRYYVETSTNGFKINFIDAPDESTDYSFDYIVIQ